MPLNKETDWIGVDLDGTLATYERGDYNKLGPYVFGDPIWSMVERIQKWCAEGIKVKIVTARHSGGRDPVHDQSLAEAIAEWTFTYIGHKLEVTNAKDGFMHELWDDRAVAVETNTGRVLGGGRSQV